jgi:hypothetical protein
MPPAPIAAGALAVGLDRPRWPITPRNCPYTFPVPEKPMQPSKTHFVRRVRAMGLMADAFLSPTMNVNTFIDFRISARTIGETRKSWVAPPISFYQLSITSAKDFLFRDADRNGATHLIFFGWTNGRPAPAASRRRRQVRLEGPACVPRLHAVVHVGDGKGAAR